MNLITQITDADIGDGDAHLLDHVSRYAARGILLRNDGKVGIIHMSAINNYKLPGGGMEKDETKRQAFIREILEETGYRAEIIHSLGYTEEHKSKNSFKQVSYCFIATASSSSTSRNLTSSEKNLGFQFVWLSIDEAIEAMKKSLNSCNEYTMRFLLLRDKIILEEARNWLAKATLKER